ncbi:YeiH family protein [Parageobacillus thermoglucosidasius]|uniref:Sulfate exporter family transporter n=1 Tax=Parageobacillus thermoglucosidasius TaxID=1426 RepID=A0AB38QXN7_PARTM|nr:putative sulfate exporter family transporter [Parageobacillus thermoglucosidasius]UOE74856.1 putative sulfate exporter family transporter [Parageobacillus thermoglucosidasius]
MHKTNLSDERALPAIQSGWAEFIRKEDWWAVWIGLFLVILAVVLWSAGHSIKVLTAQIPKWGDIHTLTDALSHHFGSIVLLFITFSILFSIAVFFLRVKLSQFVSGFIVLFILSVLINIFSSWEWAQRYTLEAPLIALAIGLVISNIIPIPDWFEAALRTELYVKVGIVLLGATLPFTLIVKAGPVAILQATIIAVVTFATIYFVGSKLGLDKRFAATLGAGGSICGVSASIAVGSSVKAKKEHVSVSISLVVIWAIVMIFALTFMIKWLKIPAGPAGAWIGTSEFADAAGITAASAFGDKALTAFTLMKVIGRDIFIGVWCFILAFISITRWEKKEEGTKADASEIWRRFPKFVLGFFAASAIVTIILASVSTASTDAINADIVAPIKELRTWAFTFCFLSIGLTTRFKQLTSVGWKPFVAFSSGVAVNVVLGYILSILLLGSYWANL